MKQINIKKISTTFFIFFCIVTLSAGSASYGHIAASGHIVKDVKFAVHKENCKSALTQASYQTPLKKASHESDRSISQAAAVGILFGARYASNPSDNMTDTKVQAIKAYRTCVKKRALKN